MAIYTLFTKDFRLREESSKLIAILSFFLISILLIIFHILVDLNLYYFYFFILLLIIIFSFFSIKNEEGLAIFLFGNSLLLAIGPGAIKLKRVLESYFDVFSSLSYLSLSYLSFALAWIGLFYIFYLSYSKIYHLREKRILKHIYPFCTIYDWYKSIRRKHTYELEMDDRTVNEKSFDSLPKPLKNRLSGLTHLKQEGYSFLLIFDESINPTTYGIKFCLDGLINEEYINYVCVDKHPYEIYDKIKDYSNDFDSSDFTIIDVFSPNFGFDDGINIDKNRKITNQGFRVINAKTVAGIHTAINKAFKITEKKVKEGEKSTRPPCRMIWESLSSLADVSSIEMIKIFLTHVVPSERNYGMISVFIEYKNTSPEILNLLRKLVDAVIFLDMKDGKISARVEKMNHAVIDEDLYKGLEWDI